MKLVKLTRPDGAPVWLVIEMIVSIGFAGQQGYQGSKAEVTHSGGKLFVRETPEEVIKLIGGQIC